MDYSRFENQTATQQRLEREVARGITSKVEYRMKVYNETEETANKVWPNPGNNTLNIRTALPNAHVEVFDLNGRLIHHQEITDETTSINAGNWASGSYVWKVISNGEETETGKWIKE